MNLYNDQLFDKVNGNLFFSITPSLSINKYEVISISELLEKTLLLTVSSNEKIIWKAHSLFPNQMKFDEENNLEPVYLRNKVFENI
jgi:hypothetical protein